MMGHAEPSVAIAGASVVGLMAALELIARGARPIVVERRARALAQPPVTALARLEVTDGALLDAWCARHAVRPPVGGVDAGVGYVDLDALWRALMVRVEAVGVEVTWGRRVLGARVMADQMCAVRTDAGEVVAQALIVAAGAEAVGITPALGIQLPVIPEWSAWMRVEGVDAPKGWQRRDEPDPSARRAVHLEHVWSDGSGTGVVGAYRSFGAVGSRRDVLARQHLEQVVAALAPSASVSAPLSWRLHAHTSADHRPVVGRAPRAAGVVLALPHGPFGNARAAEIAVAACDAVTKGAADEIVPSWSPQRFPQAASGGRMEAAR